MSTTPKTKIAHRRFFRWDYTQEQRLLDEASAQGWQLSGRTPWRVTYAYDPDVRYRYAIDFRRDHDEARYLDTCREMGWELAAGLGDATPLDWGHHGFPWNDYFTPKAHPADGRWYIFRKPYGSDLAEDDYSIATPGELQEAATQQTLQKLRMFVPMMIHVSYLFLFFWMGIDEGLWLRMFIAAGIPAGLALCLILRFWVTHILKNAENKIPSRRRLIFLTDGISAIELLILLLELMGVILLLLALIHLY
jgi:hypothetical protein